MPARVHEPVEAGLQKNCNWPKNRSPWDAANPMQLDHGRWGSSTPDRLKTATEIRLEPVAETMRFLQTMPQSFVVHCVGGGGKVEQHKNSQIATVYRPKIVRQNTQKRHFSRTIGEVRRPQVGH